MPIDWPLFIKKSNPVHRKPVILKNFRACGEISNFKILELGAGVVDTIYVSLRYSLQIDWPLFIQKSNLVYRKPAVLKNRLYLY